ncbi:MAG: YcfL family protein [Sedimentisphaerales bacterium]|nr:YcfL family protein [Sedimentisphaerales bacterium]
MRTLAFTLLLVVLSATSCYQPQDSRIHVREGVRSDSLDNNIVTKPVAHAFSALIGEGIVINNAVAKRNDAGLLEVHVNGFNQSYETKRFRYRVEWLDESGSVIESKTSVWLPMSAMGKSPFSFKAAAPKPEAVNFRMDTKKWE